SIKLNFIDFIDTDKLVKKIISDFVDLENNQYSLLDKLKTIIWYLRYKNLDFKNYIFVDEKAVRIGLQVLFHWYLASN
ncbi:hypothetical protein BpHYR1_027471, partial [Brachionus plicatilis]